MDMGFALWTDDELAWAAGTSEYRAMGVAVIAGTDLFRAADFRPTRRSPRTSGLAYQGYFASIGQMNAHLVAGRGRRTPRRKRDGTGA